MWGAAAGVALLLASSACSGGADEDPTEPSFVPVPSTSEAEPSATSSADPSADATATAEALVAPELPAVATEETPEGAAAFAEWWFETLNYATATGDTGELRAAFQEECVTCQGFVGRIDDAYGSNGRIEGGLLDVQVESSAVQEGISTMPVLAEAQAGEVLSADGATETVLTAERVNLVIAVAWTGSAWVVGDLVA